MNPQFLTELRGFVWDTIGENKKLLEEAGQYMKEINQLEHNMALGGLSTNQIQNPKLKDLNDKLNVVKQKLSSCGYQIAIDEHGNNYLKKIATEAEKVVAKEAVKEAEKIPELKVETVLPDDAVSNVDVPNNFVTGADVEATSRQTVTVIADESVKKAVKDKTAKSSKSILKGIKEVKLDDMTR